MPASGRESARSGADRLLGDLFAAHSTLLIASATGVAHDLHYPLRMRPHPRYSLVEPPFLPGITNMLP